MLAFEVFPPQKPDGTFGDMGDLGLLTISFSFDGKVFD
jgi:hypothetical protein